MNSKQYPIVWLGCISTSSYLLECSALSAAANEWQALFLRHLPKRIHPTLIISHIPYPAWPSGPLWVKHISEKLNEVPIINVSYLNIYLIRDLWISLCSLSLLFNALIKTGWSSMLITYNKSLKSSICGLLAKIMRFEWTEIFADGDSPSKLASCHLFLSPAAYLRFKTSFNNSFLFPPAIARRSHVNTFPHLIHGKPYIMYSGTISEWTGIIDFAAKFENAKLANDFTLVITGKRFEKIHVSPLMQTRIFCTGFIDSGYLSHLLKHASAFVNPRPANFKAKESANNFPSKILHYLSYGKPVFTTRTSNIHKELEPLLNFYETLDDISFQLSDQHQINLKCQRIRSSLPCFTWDYAVSNFFHSIQS